MFSTILSTGTLELPVTKRGSLPACSRLFWDHQRDFSWFHKALFARGLGYSARGSDIGQLPAEFFVFVSQGVVFGHNAISFASFIVEQNNGALDFVEKEHPSNKQCYYTDHPRSN